VETPVMIARPLLPIGDIRSAKNAQRLASVTGTVYQVYIINDTLAHGEGIDTAPRRAAAR
jgi:hypothetical protein